MFPQIGRKKTLRNEVASYLKELIKSGKLQPGDRLPTEREMAEKFGVSRTVIRDAVKTLSGIGILEVKHGIGIFVARANPQIIARQLSSLLVNESDTIENLFEVRLVLETAAARWSAKRCTEEYRQRITNFIAESNNLIESKKIDVKSYRENDQEFHMLVSEMTGNPVVVRLMSSMLDLLKKSRDLTHTIPGRPDLSIKEHIKILEAIYHGKEDEASLLMQAHLVSVLNSIKQTITKK